MSTIDRSESSGRDILNSFPNDFSPAPDFNNNIVTRYYLSISDFILFYYNCSFDFFRIYLWMSFLIAALYIYDHRFLFDDYMKSNPAVHYSSLEIQFYFCIFILTFEITAKHKKL